MSMRSVELPVTMSVSQTSVYERLPQSSMCMLVILPHHRPKLWPTPSWWLLSESSLLRHRWVNKFCIMTIEGQRLGWILVLHQSSSTATFFVTRGSELVVCFANTPGVSSSWVAVNRSSDMVNAASRLCWIALKHVVSKLKQKMFGTTELLAVGNAY